MLTTGRTHAPCSLPRISAAQVRGRYGMLVRRFDRNMFTCAAPGDGDRSKYTWQGRGLSGRGDPTAGVAR